MGFWKEFFSLKRTDSTEPSLARRGFSFTAGVAVTEETAMKVSAYYRGKIYIATQIAKLPWDVKDKDNNIVESGVSKLLNLQPNPEMNAMTFRIWAVSTAIDYGNAYAEIERNVIGTPTALWPLHSRNVEPVRDPQGKLWYRVTGENAEAGELFLEPRNVFHVKNLHTRDGISGQGLPAFASQTLGISLAADRMAGNLFSNGGIPSGIITHPSTLSDEAYTRMKQSWAEKHGGERSGGLAIFEEGAKFEPINIDPDVMQFLESRKFGVLELARYFGLPPTKLFDMSTATYSNVENANLEVATDTLDTWACNLEMEADVKLLNLRYGGAYTELDLYSVFRGDMAARGSYFKVMMSVGAMSPNEIRRKEGMPKQKDGDKYFIATNNFSPMDRLDEIVDADIKGKTQPKPATPKKTEEDEDVDKAVISYLTKG